jgi:hypothetical protein
MEAFLGNRLGQLSLKQMDLAQLGNAAERRAR